LFKVIDVGTPEKLVSSACYVYLRPFYAKLVILAEIAKWIKNEKEKKTKQRKGEKRERKKKRQKNSHCKIHAYSILLHCIQ